MTSLATGGRQPGYLVLMRSLWLLPALISCDAPFGTLEPPCSGSVLRHSAAGESLRIRSERCGDLVIDGFSLEGEGEMLLDLFTDGTRTLPKITAAGSDAVFRRMTARGLLALSGAWPARAVILGERAEESYVADLSIDPAAPSFGAGLIGRGDGGSVLIGLHSASAGRFSVTFSPQSPDGRYEIELAWEIDEGVPLEGGEALYLDPLFLAMSADPGELWRAWPALAQSVRAPLVGWPVADEGSLGEILAQDLPVDAIRLEAGWERQIGEWEAGDAFPSGLSAIAEQISLSGATPALVWSPLVAAPNAPIFESHPSWWVSDGSGGALDYEGLRVLDVTEPEAAEWLGEQMRAKVREGFLLQRLDHFGACVTPGTCATALQILREAAPEATLVAGEGAPLLPSIGWLDGLSAPADATESLSALSFLTVDRPLPEEGSLGWAVAALSGGALWVSRADQIPIASAIVATSPGLTEPGSQLGFAAPSQPVRWRGEGLEVLLNTSPSTVSLQGPGGEELLSGQLASPGVRTLPAASAEIWRSP